MARIRKIVLYITAFSAFIFVVYFLQLMAVRMSLNTSLLLAAGAGVYSALMAALSLWFRSYLHRKAFTGKKQAYADMNMDTHQQRTVEIDLPYEAAFDLALDALKTLDRQL